MSYASLLRQELREKEKERHYSEKEAFALLIGQRLKLIRESKGMDQDTLAGRLDMTQSAYSKIETGITQVSAWQIAQFARVLGTTLLSIIPPAN